MVYQISSSEQSLHRLGWGGVRPAPAGLAGGGLARLGEGGAPELAQGGAGQGGEQVDALGALVARQGGARVRDQGGLVEGAARAQRDQGGDLLAPVRVRH